MLKELSFRLGLITGGNPLTSIFGAIMILIVCSTGFVNWRITDDPQELWVPPASRANREQDYFQEKFGPFFRINTIWLTPGVGQDADADIFQSGYLEMLYHLQMAIEDGTSSVNGKDYSVDDFCYKPIGGEGCIVTSPMQYWRSDLQQLWNDPDVKQTAQCIAAPDATDRVCFDKIGVPVMQFTIFGKLTCATPKKNECSECSVNAAGLQVTFLLLNNDYSTATAEQWESDVFIRNIKSFNKAMGDDYHTDLDDGQDYNQDLIDKIKVVQGNSSYGSMITLKADYMAERSIPDNITEESSENAFVIGVSYLLMFLYVGCAIGHLPSKVHSKFSLGFAGIFVVISSLVSAIGITFYMNDKLTMISAEVVPFLILAIGVDNMFLISRAEKQIPDHIVDIKFRIAFAMKEIGPSIFVAAFCEALAFFIGMQTDIPALQSFCLVAGIAVITDFFFQITIFLPVLALDHKRIKQDRYDIFCCFKSPIKTQPREDFVRTKFNKYVVPFVFRKTTKVLTMIITVLLCVIGGFSCAKLLRGLNQNVSLVAGSDIFDYFETLFAYGYAGPPGYVVFNNVDYTNQTNLDQMESIDAELAALNNTIQSPIYSWVAPFQDFTRPGKQVWSDDCNSQLAIALPFDQQMKMFTQISIEGQCCQKYGICGEQYSQDIVFDDYGRVETTRFRFQHQPLKHQEDYIQAVVETRKATDKFAERLTPVSYNYVNVDLKLSQPKGLMQRLKSFVGLGSKQQDLIDAEAESPIVFCYSLFYVYYDQYTYITGVLAQDVMMGLIGVFFAIQILSSLQISLFITLCVFLVFFELMGCMWMLNEILGGYPVEHNAVFVVNLVTSLGFGVEFCNHIGMNFMRQTGTREQRARKALTEMGASVLVGIATTKFIGVIVLAFAPSTLFQLYYFRMYLFIIVFGVFNGLVFLPTLLSLIGPAEDKSEIIEGYQDKKFFRLAKMRMSGQTKGQ